MYFWYRFFTYLFYPFAPIYLYFRKIRKKEDPIRYKEKLSKIILPRGEGLLVWLHVASVGEAMSILPLVNSIIKEKKIPIVVPMGTSDDKKTYNINADIAAGSVAKELNSRRLLLMTDVEGVLDKNKKLIPEINSLIAEKMLKDGDISGGMIPKINTCLDAVNNGVTGVVIVDGRKPHSILFELFSDKGAGTLIRK